MLNNRTKIMIGVVLLILIAAVTALIMHLRRDDRQSSTYDGTPYDATKEIALALNDLSKGENNRAEIIKKIKTKENILALSFQGLSDVYTNEAILDLLNEQDRKVDFFISGMLMAENTKFVKALNKTGHSIGNNGLSQTSNMQDFSMEALINEFVQTNVISQKIIGKVPNALMCTNTIYTDNVLRAAYVSGNEKVVQPTRILNYQSFNSYNQVLNYILKLDKGSIITVKMDGVLEESEYDPGEEKTEPAIDKKPKRMGKSQITELSPEEKLVVVVDWLLKALKETDYEIVLVEDLSAYEEDWDEMDYAEEQDLNKEGGTNAYHPTINGSKTDPKGTKDKYLSKKILENLRRKNNGKKAKVYNTIYTTEKALSYTFYGISNTKVLDQVMDNLDALKAKGTFYVTEKDVINYPDSIRKIARNGHEIGIGLIEHQENDFYSTLASIVFIQKEVNKLTNQMPNLVRYPYYIDLSNAILEAIASANAVVVWQDISIASSSVGVNGTLEAVMDNAFGQGNITARRGYIIYYRMDYYHNPTIIPNAMLKIAKDRIDTIAYKDAIIDNGSAYAIKTLGHIMNGKMVYNYPLKDEEILSQVKNKIRPGYLASYTESDKFNLIEKRYIGNPDVSKANTLPGFSDDELNKINNTGRFTEDKVLFLTFDDWSSDKPINQLLYVLGKHNVEASFFIRTNYMQNNPNILRAIVEAGHDVGSHTDEHLPFATIQDGSVDAEDTTMIYHALTENEVLARKNDLQRSYNKLQYVVGDLMIDNRPALTTIFRPPTLAMSRNGMETIFDMGFTHIVSGDFSSGDYEDTDPKVLVDKLINGMVTGGGNIRRLQNGSIIVMHMADGKDNSIYSSNVTAEALDIAIPILKAKGYSFARLSDYLR